MRIYEIALFMLLVNVLIAFSANQDLFSNSKFIGTTGTYDSDLIGGLNISAQNESGYRPFGGTESTNFILATLTALGNVVDIIWRSTVGLQYTLTQFMGGSAAAASVAWVIAIPVWLVYIFAIAQFLRGVGGKSIQ